MNMVGIMMATGSFLVGVSLGCSNSIPEEARADADAHARPASRARRLWSFDLSDERVAGMTLEQLWLVGVECLQWPADVPRDATKTVIHARLMEAKYRHVGDFDDTDDDEGLR